GDQRIPLRVVLWTAGSVCRKYHTRTRSAYAVRHPRRQEQARELPRLLNRNRGQSILKRDNPVVVIDRVLGGGDGVCPSMVEDQFSTAFGEPSEVWVHRIQDRRKFLVHLRHVLVKIECLPVIRVRKYPSEQPVEGGPQGRQHAQSTQIDQ